MERAEQALERFIREAFPEDQDAAHVFVEAIEAASLRVRLEYHARFLRPGESISGPTMMKLADMVTYLALISQDEGAKRAVTSSLNIHFLRRPKPGDMIAVAQVLKRGRSLAVAQVELFSEADMGDGEPVAVASVTYALPSGLK